MATPLPTFSDIPTVDQNTPVNQVKTWFYQRRVQVEGLARQLNPKSDFSQDTMERLGAKIRNAETRLAGGEDHVAVVADFRAWVVDGSDYGAWNYYKTWQLAQDQAAADALAKAAAEQALSDAKNAANRAATSETKKRPRGLMNSDNTAGRVIAGLAFIGTPGVTYFGISGVDMHAASGLPVNQVITALLSGATQAEKWPLAACAEVDALKRYLTANGITSVAAIPKDTLVFHAEVWNPGQQWDGKTTSPHWQPRAACKNCKQWIGKIGALLA